MVVLLVPLLLADACLDGAAAARNRDFGLAEKLLGSCVAKPAAPLEAFLLLCGVYQAQGKSDDLARAALAGIKRFPGDKRFYLTAGTIAGRQRKYANAVGVLEPAVERWPEDEKLRALLGSAYFGRGTESLDATRNEEAVRDLRRAADLMPADAEAQMNLGRALHNLLRHADALAAFDQVLKAQPDFPLLHFHRGLALYSLGEFDASVNALNSQISANPSYPPAYLVRGMARLSKGEPAEAAPDLEKAAAGMPDDANAQMSCARVLIQLRRLTDAEPRLRKAMVLDPSNPAPVNTLVSLLLQLGRSEEAKPLARQAAELARRKRSVSEGEIRFEKATR